MAGVGNWVFQILVALDQLLNSIAGGWADETLSARAWRHREESNGWAVARRLFDAMFFWQTEGHCMLAYIAELNRAQSPVDERQSPLTEQL